MTPEVRKKFQEENQKNKDAACVSKHISIILDLLDNRDTVENYCIEDFRLVDEIVSKLQAKGWLVSKNNEGNLRIWID